MRIYNYNLSRIDVCYVLKLLRTQDEHCGPPGAEDHRLRTTATIAHECF